MEATKVGIKETKEAVKGFLKLAKTIAVVAKDGLKLTDATSIYELVIKDADFKADLEAAAKGIEQVPAEVKDLDVPEVFELVAGSAKDVLALVEALKKS